MTRIDTSMERRPLIQPPDGPPPGSPLAYALAYAALGWYVLPLHSIRDGACTCGNPHCKSPGKHPIKSLVPNGARDASIDPRLITGWWTMIPGANPGIRTGQASGIWVSDVDPLKGGDDSLERLIAQHGPLPATAQQITGGGGSHYIWRWPSDGRHISSTAGQIAPGLDVRGSNGYIVAEPGLHISGHSYVWEGSSDPTEGVEPADAPEWLLALVCGREDRPHGATDIHGLRLDERRVLELRQALGYLDADDYDTWVKVGMALHSSGTGEQAFGLWNEWSQLSAKYDAKTMRPKWASFRDRAGGLELSSIFALAQGRGWVNPASRFAQDFEAATRITLEQANRKPPEPVLIAETAPTTRAFPVGGLDEVAAWIDSLATVSSPAVTQQAVLTLVSATVARTYITPQGDPLSLYLGCCGRSIGELRYVHHAVNAAMGAAGLRRMVRGTRMTSPASIYKSLLRSPATVYLSDDYGGVAAFSKRQPSGLQEHALSLIAALYDGKTVQLDGPEEAGLRTGVGHDEQPVIYAPSLSILALIGMDQLAVLMRQSETGRGALQQMLFAINDERVLSEREPQDRPPPAWLPDWMRQVRRVPHPGHGTDLALADIFQSIATMPPTPMMVPFGVALTPVYAELDTLSSDRRVRSLLLAARTIVRRLAAALAAWQAPDAPVVTREILEWTAAYVSDRLRETIEQFEILHSVDGKSSIYDQVLARITEAKTTGVSKRDLTIGCWGYRNLPADKRGELIELMLQDQSIVEMTTVDATTKRKSKVFVAAKFVEGSSE